MSGGSIAESHVEEAALDWLAQLGYTVLHGPEITGSHLGAERETHHEVILRERLRTAIAQINPGISVGVLDEATAIALRTEHPDLIDANRRFHRFLTDGIDIEYRRPDGAIGHDKVWLLDYANPANNDWLAVNQFTVIERDNRRPDIVLCVNGLPLA